MRPLLGSLLLLVGHRVQYAADVYRESLGQRRLHRMSVEIRLRLVKHATTGPLSMVGCGMSAYGIFSYTFSRV